MISTGFSNLDGILGGGLGESTISEFYGKNSTGKTSFAMGMTAHAQKEGKNVVYLDLENSFHEDYAKRIGVDLKNLYLVSSISNPVAVIRTMFDEEWADLLVIDSLASMDIPVCEVMIEMCNDYLMDIDCHVMILNQIRANIGGVGDRSYGPRNLPLSASYRVNTYQNGKVRINGETQGVWINFEVVKNRFEPPFKNVDLKLMYNDGFQNGEALWKRRH